MFEIFRKREPVPPTITTVTADYENGDILVLSTDQVLTQAAREAMRVSLDRLVSKDEKHVIVIEGGLKLSVIRAGK